jgi:hypothetical protein
MAETAFIAALADYLTGALTAPAPKLIGVAEPDSADQLPAIVLSLDSTERVGNGVGERSTLITDGALPWTASIDLANPFLPEEPTFKLLDDARRTLVLPHGGLVKQDGSSGSLAPEDITIRVQGNAVPLAAAPAAAGRVSVDPTIGTLTFGTALSATGTVVATYFLGQWEQRIVRIEGVLRADVCAATADATATLADAMLAALTAPEARTSIRRLLRLDVSALTSVGAVEQPLALRRRRVSFSFAYENEDNRPDSSGGIIARIPIVTRLNVGSADPNTGAVNFATVTVPG